MTETPSAPAYDVVVVGSVNRDYTCRVDVLPARGQTVLGGEASVGSGGKGGNQAVAASLMGARTALVARIGGDDDGRALLTDLSSAWVDTQHVVTVPGARTGMAFVLVDATGDNSIVVAPGANGHLEAFSVERTLQRLLRPPAVLVTQAEIPTDALVAAVTAAAEAGCRAVVNLAPYRPVSGDFLARCDPLVVNESEASDLLGRPVSGLEAARRAVEDIQRSARSVVLTVGAGGAVVAEGGAVHHVAADLVAVVDTTGAGDAFTGALAAALSAGRELVGAVGIGVRAGTYAVSRAGAQASYPDLAALGLSPLRRRD